MPLHCWKDYRRHLEETGKIYSAEWANTYLVGNKTCMADAGHEGEHEFVDDGAIEVQSADKDVE